jgi:hypothetical protein
MDWLVVLLVLLGLAALAGLVWLHLGHTPITGTGKERGGRGLNGSELDSEGIALSVTMRTLRQRAAHYRDISLTVDDPVAGARCWDVARLLDRAADALENPPAEDAPDRRR